MLVSYSSSSEEEDENQEAEKRKRGRCHGDDSACKKLKSTTVKIERGLKDGRDQTALPRLPLPDSLLDMFKDTEERVTEDPSLHGGRTRSFKHERGNWATYVYMPYIPGDSFWELLDEMTRVASSHSVRLTPSEEFHISLSHTVVLRHHWIQPFVQSLRTGLAHCRRFTCAADRLKVYTNQEGSRTFLGVEVCTGQAQLTELLKVVDQTMEEFSLSKFYQDPSFHLSLAWCVGDCAEQILSECLSELQGILDGHDDGNFLFKLACDELRCKTGNKVFTFPLG